MALCSHTQRNNPSFVKVCTSAAVVDQFNRSLRFAAPTVAQTYPHLEAVWQEGVTQNFEGHFGCCIYDLPAADYLTHSHPHGVTY